MSGKRGMKHYPAEMKLEVVRQFYEEGRTQAEITSALGICDPHRAKVWLKQYRREGYEGFSKPIGRPRQQAENAQTELKRLRMENTLLKKFHTELRKEVRAKRNIGLSTITKKNTK